MPFKQFNRENLKLKPLAERENLVTLSDLIHPDSPRTSFDNPHIPVLAQEILQSTERKSAILFSCGAHVIKSGLGPVIVDLIERKMITHLALNGAGAIHDFELALIGGTSERVAEYIRQGQFGMWKETGIINDAVKEGCKKGLGFGESVGLMIENENFPNKNISVLAAGIRAGIPVTVHVGIGQDIIHEHPNFDPASTGTASYRDFLVYTESVANLEGGVFINIGTAVMGPEVYLKALSMARNVASQKGKSICHFTTAVFDIQEIGGDYSAEAPKNDPRYYFRPFKTILVRTVADGGKSYYVCGEHKYTIPKLYDEIIAGIK
jgi:hypothetical protein